jgi:sorting nexin-25
LDGLEKDHDKDDIAEPVYQMAKEIFDLQETAGLLRKTLIAFVQISFGKTINKQVRETVSWVCSEAMIHYYLVSFRDALWPEGAAAAPWPERSDHQREETMILTKRELLNNIPDALGSLLGNDVTRKGVNKLFDVLQHKQLNKQLFYELMEAFLFQLVPELLKDKDPSSPGVGGGGDVFK